MTPKRGHFDGAAAANGADNPATNAGERLLPLVLESLENDKAEDVITIDLSGKSSMCDYMIVASGRSQRQVAAMAEHLREAVKAASAQAPAVEGLPAADWVLIDGGDIIVHLFRPEVRSFYNLEKMWGIDLPEAPAAGAPDRP